MSQLERTLALIYSLLLLTHERPPQLTCELGVSNTVFVKRLESTNVVPGSVSDWSCRWSAAGVGTPSKASTADSEHRFAPTASGGVELDACAHATVAAAVSLWTSGAAIPGATSS